MNNPKKIILNVNNMRKKSEKDIYDLSTDGEGCDSEVKESSKLITVYIPELEVLEEELKKERYRRRYGNTLKSTIYALITVAAVAVLVATLLLPVLQIYGSSMTPTLQDGNIVVSLKTSDFKVGDIIAFYYNNKILVKRVIASSGEWVNIDDSGTVFVNGKELDEPYIEQKAIGDCDIRLPYQVPDECVFVMGDHRSVSLDSRKKAIGAVSQEQIVGKLVFRLWPIIQLGTID